LSQWFRVYDFTEDFDVHRLDDKTFRVMFGLMPVIARHGPEILADEKSLCWFLRCKPRRLRNALKKLREVGLLDADGNIRNFSVPAQQRANTAEWATLRSLVFSRDNYTCRYCGERGGKLECDHVIPHSRGGPDHEDNLVTSCFKCNRAKRDKTLEEWLGKNTLDKA